MPPIDEATAAGLDALEDKDRAARAQPSLEEELTMLVASQRQPLELEPARELVMPKLGIPQSGLEAGTMITDFAESACSHMERTADKRVAEAEAFREQVRRFTARIRQDARVVAEANVAITKRADLAAAMFNQIKSLYDRREPPSTSETVTDRKSVV